MGRHPWARSCYTVFCLAFLTHCVAAVERHYYIAAVNIDWDYTSPGQPRTGPTYKKVVYREYDAEFKQAKTHPSWLGLLGPTLRGQEGDVIVVTFRNMADHRCSIHPHGIAYGKQSEGSFYNDNTFGFEKEDDIVVPGGEHTYYWEVTSEVSPKPGDPSCLTYTYLSHHDIVSDYNTGLIGTMLICKNGSLSDDGEQVRFHQEMVLLFGVFDEDKSWYRGGTPSRQNLKYTINGFTNGSVPDLSVCAHSTVSWHFLAMSSQPELFSVHFNGQVLLQNGHSTSVVGLISGTATSASMTAVHPGRWLLSSYISKHFEAGMYGFLMINTCKEFSAPKRRLTIQQKRESREWTFYIAAEEVIWDYAPNIADNIDKDFRSMYLKQGPDRIGKKYKKAVYTQYTDETFTERAEKKQRKKELGILGPVIRAQIRDRIKIVFKNKATRPYSIYPHGLTIDKAAEGARYPDGGNQTHAVQPGETYEYIWNVIDEDEPTDSDSRCVTRMYHSAVDTHRDIASGLIGPLLICKSQSLNKRNVQLKSDKEQHAMFAIFDENKSWYLDENINSYCSDPARVQKDDPEFYKANVMHTINGYVYESGELLGFCNGEIVTWHVSNVGEQDRIQTATFYGHIFELNNRYEDFLSLFPMTGETITMPMDNKGIWLLASLNSHETTKGMRMRFRDVDCYRDYFTEEEYSDTDYVQESFSVWTPQQGNVEEKKAVEPPQVKNANGFDALTDYYADLLNLRSFKKKEGDTGSDMELLDLSMLDFDDYDASPVNKTDQNSSFILSDELISNETQLEQTNSSQTLSDILMAEMFTADGNFTTVPQNESAVRTLLNNTMKLAPVTRNNSLMNDTENVSALTNASFEQLVIKNNFTSGTDHETVQMMTSSPSNETSKGYGDRSTDIGTAYVGDFEDIPNNTFPYSVSHHVPPFNDSNLNTELHESEIFVLLEDGNPAETGSDDRQLTGYIIGPTTSVPSDNRSSVIGNITGDSSTEEVEVDHFDELFKNIDTESTNNTLSELWEMSNCTQHGKKNTNFTSDFISNSSLSLGNEGLKNASFNETSIESSSSSSADSSDEIISSPYLERCNSSEELSSERTMDNASAFLSTVNFSNASLGNETDLAFNESKKLLSNSVELEDSSEEDVSLHSESHEEVAIYLKDNKTGVILTTPIKLQGEHWRYEGKHELVPMEIPDHITKYTEDNSVTNPSDEKKVEEKKKKIVYKRVRPHKGHALKTKKRKEYKAQPRSAISPRSFKPPTFGPRGTRPVSSEEDLMSKPIVIGLPRSDFNDYELYVQSEGDDIDHVGGENEAGEEYEYVEYKDPYSTQSDMQDIEIDEAVKYTFKKAGSNVRTYFISAEEVEWDYLGYGRRRMEKCSTKVGLTKFTKVVFRGYLDSSFRIPDIRGEVDEHLGILGPVIKAEVGETIMILFRNLARRPYSLHAKGVTYPKQMEGLNYNDESPYWYKLDDKVQPNSSNTYIWTVTQKAGPQDDESDCRTWAYYSGVNPEKDINSGLIGPLLVCRKGTLSKKAMDSSRFMLLFMTFDENMSWYYEENRKKFERTNKLAVTRPDFNENIRFHAINGIICNLKGLRMYTNQLVKWHLINLGSSRDFHSIHFHGQTFLNKQKGDHRQGVYPLLPGGFATLEMLPSKPGLWLLESEIGLCQENGMQTLFLVIDNECSHPLGLISGSILDTQITASDYRGYWLPHLARLHNSGKYNAWSTMNQEEWIKVDFQRPVVISKVATQGAKQLFTSHYVVNFTISYSNDGKRWIYYKGDSDTIRKTFEGNRDAHEVKENTFFPPIIGRYVRLHPSQSHNYPTVRMEFYGCELDGCSVPLGMGNGLIKDHQITASSVAYSWYSGSWHSWLARLDKQGAINAWQAKDRDMQQWLQVELNVAKKITGIITQGAKSLGTEMFVTEYILEYSDDGRKWTKYSDDPDKELKIFQGNSDNNGHKRNYIYPPIFSRFIRIIPKRWQNSITMRVELLGCDS
ncbi:coagulation factor V isoform X2 [Chanos chanos]|uniref:ferroxidase n=1 Tax=Chanos chanos TaxID=29144 RepID=A0A6J2W8J6_CHACN|nr:coagulation factor V isoform X2 [Chanos chanos]